MAPVCEPEPSDRLFVGEDDGDGDESADPPDPESPELSELSGRSYDVELLDEDGGVLLGEDDGVLLGDDDVREERDRASDEVVGRSVDEESDIPPNGRVLVPVEEMLVGVVECSCPSTSL
ncbi:hypothetical protein MSPP1_003600 [Malassezia sp. CBS 17886]|nr:hypothetical protein MSPP1_003600 [Malassezia sp. CBS 17886]